MTTAQIQTLLNKLNIVTPPLVVDGDPGPKTLTAIAKFKADNNITGADFEDALLAANTPKITLSFTPNNNPVDARSEGEIATLLPEVQPLARQLVNQSVSQGFIIKIISGTRTYDEQNALYAQGRTAPGSVVTKAKGGYSNHNFGLAFDIGLFKAADYIDDSPDYTTVSEWGKELGLTWGGDWQGIVDQPHYELRPSWAIGMSESDMLAELRHRKENNIPVFQ